MGFKCGIVGLPNVGKSTLFNALTSTQAAEAANYPFCTIEPNVGRVGVPDDRLHVLAKLANSQKIIPTQLEFVDIAGLVKGASKGEGLGNQFLGHIREVDAIIHVVRCYEDENITHVEGNVLPKRDAEIIETELMLADLESIEKRLPNLQKKAKTGDKEAKTILPLLEQAKSCLEAGKHAFTIKDTLNEEETKLFKSLQLLTAKPILYVGNVAETALAAPNEHMAQLEAYAALQNADIVFISAAIEAELATLDEISKQEFLQELGLEEAGLNRVIAAGYHLLHLITFFTIGPKEAHAWTLPKGLKAPDAAGVIHTDFQRGFICAETISYQDYITYKGELGAKEAGKMRQEGKGYVVEDGDIFHFRFNV